MYPMGIAASTLLSIGELQIFGFIFSAVLCLINRAPSQSQLIH